ncbi:hypothetical protein theurythT_06000 [Thalassotalea eurytherma]|uniref:9-hexadecenoic acid cis-trans isomerase n=1 Tax=Thalassotalea eurytherma TaxID=1144278 RepID=A0ABQ6GYY7_9GAMM|nr:hypothetical protein theurythT_06000 [Thalassotalea eurytherma]
MENGASYDERAPLDEALKTQINRWELFLNQQSKKQRLVARYIYEHWFLAHIYFDEVAANGDPIFFRLVRSKTPPGEPIDIISTRRPYDDPGVKSFYYRLWQERGSVLLKTHLPLALNTSRMARITELFLAPKYNVFNFPSYKSKTASNPFKAFEQIPTQSKYQFMLDEAQFTIMGFIKGPVCRGQTALSVINDRLWVFFVDPNYFSSEKVNQFLAKQTNNLRLPAESESNALTVTNWFKYAGAQSDYLKAKQKLINKEYKGVKTDLQLIWQGDGYNKNASLTIFRHFDSATVEKGLIGETPKTAWLIDYALLERIHYLLVAGFDVYGNVGHQFNTRAYMDYLRMEGENNFLSLLPKESRQALRKYWYRDASAPTIKFLRDEAYQLNRETSITYKTSAPFDELLTMIKHYLSPVLSHRFDLDETRDHMELTKINKVPAKAANLMPEISMLMVSNNDGSKRAYSLLRNSAHYNILSMFNEEDRRAYDEDNLTIVPGFIGDYPGALWHTDEENLRHFVNQLRMVNSEEDYQTLRTHFGIRRTDVNFWQFSDDLHRLAKQYKGIEYGLFDYNRLQDR